MITSHPTEHLTGITIEGTFNDFYETVESIHRVTGLEKEYGDPLWSAKNRLLGVCYDMRHAYMGDRNVALADNGVNEEMMKWHSIIMPKQEVRFSFNILFPEAVFVALTSDIVIEYSGIDYGKKAKKRAEDSDFLCAYDYAEYIKDTASIKMLAAAIFYSLAEVISDEELEKVIKLNNYPYGMTWHNYVGQYVDKCNIEYLKSSIEKRKDKLKNIEKRFVQFPEAYHNMKRDLEYSARKYGCSIHELHDPKLEYPEEVEW